MWYFLCLNVFSAALWCVSVCEALIIFKTDFPAVLSSCVLKTSCHNTLDMECVQAVSEKIISASERFDKMRFLIF